MDDRDIIRYGETESTTDLEGGYTTVRTIRYNGELYLHIMNNGEVVAIEKIKEG